MKHLPPIIALCGPAGCGKATVAGIAARILAREQLAVTVSLDVREPWEARGVRGAGGVIVRIVRPGHQPAAGAPDLQPDYELHNNGGLYELADKVSSLLGRISADRSVELVA